MPSVRLPQLDVLRGICALLVVFYHVLFQHPGHELGLFRNAALFVDFFFVLSGFIMFHNYADLTGWRQLGRFVGLRFFRTYPLHVVMVGVYLVYEVVQYLLVHVVALPTATPPFSENNGKTLLLNLLLLNGVGIADLSFNTPSWSISTEFWAYVVFGLSMLAVVQRRGLLLLFSALALGSLAFLAMQPDPSLTAHWQRFMPRCLFGFFLGATLRGVMSVEPARPVEPSDPPGVHERRGASAWGDALQAATLALSAALVSVASGRWLWLELLAPFVFAAVIASFVAWPRSSLVRALDNGPLLWLGKVSFSIYMVHQFVLQMIQAFMRLVLKAPVKDGLILVGDEVGAIALVLALTLVLIVATFTYRYVEEPARRAGRAWLSGVARARREPQSEPSVIG